MIQIKWEEKIIGTMWWFLMHYGNSVFTFLLIQRFDLWKQNALCNFEIINLFFFLWDYDTWKKYRDIPNLVLNKTSRLWYMIVMLIINIMKSYLRRVNRKVLFKKYSIRLCLITWLQRTNSLCCNRLNEIFR